MWELWSSCVGSKKDKFSIYAKKVKKSETKVECKEENKRTIKELYFETAELINKEEKTEKKHKYNSSETISTPDGSSAKSIFDFSNDTKP
jgi:hypothetical protein